MACCFAYGCTERDVFLPCGASRVRASIQRAHSDHWTISHRLRQTLGAVPRIVSPIRKPPGRQHILRPCSEGLQRAVRGGIGFERDVSRPEVPSPFILSRQCRHRSTTLEGNFRCARVRVLAVTGCCRGGGEMGCDLGSRHSPSLRTESIAAKSTFGCSETSLVIGCLNSERVHFALNRGQVIPPLRRRTRRDQRCVASRSKGRGRGGQRCRIAFDASKFGENIVISARGALGWALKMVRRKWGVDRKLVAGAVAVPLCRCACTQSTGSTASCRRPTPSKHNLSKSNELLTMLPRQRCKHTHTLRLPDPN